MKKFLILLAVGVVLAAAPAHAALQVDVTQGNAQPLPIAIPDFVGDPQMGANVAGVVRADLERSGLFRPLDQKGFAEHITDINKVPTFTSWRSITAQGLVTGQVVQQPDGRLRVDFRLWDVFGQSQMLGLQFFTTPENWRRIAHMVSDAVYERVTGEKGYFDTRIVFISESGAAQKRVKRLGIMDEDGANPIFLTNGSYMVLTPRFNPTAQMIAYMSYIGTKPRVYLFDIESGKQEVLGNFPNMTFSPRFSPDGNRVVLSRAENGVTNLYALDLRTRRATRLTDSQAIDTSPCFSPDGSKIAFNSDRGGSQQLYVMNADGGDVKRISFGSGKYGTPVWSPRGDLIAFTKIDGGSFFIGVMRPDGSGERLLTRDFLVEGPTWAPNGRVLMYYRQSPSDSRGHGGSTRLFSIDLTGSNQREVITPQDASDPAWSPLLR